MPTTCTSETPLCDTQPAPEAAVLTDVPFEPLRDGRIGAASPDSRLIDLPAKERRGMQLDHHRNARPTTGENSLCVVLRRLYYVETFRPGNGPQPGSGAGAP